MLLLLLLPLEKPFLCVCVCLRFSIFHFARVNLQLSPATAAASATASATSSRVGAKCSFPLCGAMPQRGWHAASAAASILRDAAAKRRGQGSVRRGSSKVARQKFKVQSEHFRFSPLINVSKLAAQLHLPLATCHNSYGYGSWLLTPDSCWFLVRFSSCSGVEFIDSQSTPAAFDLFAQLDSLRVATLSPFSLSLSLPLLKLSPFSSYLGSSPLLGLQFNKQHLIKFKSIRLCPRLQGEENSSGKCGKTRVGNLKRDLAIWLRPLSIFSLSS